MRERIYLESSDDGAIGGALLYAVQPGGDGTLGGMIALVPKFQRIIESALGYIDNCSNDPLCGEHLIQDSRINGAACYACSLLSETSCEWRNHSLDRMLLHTSLTPTASDFTTSPRQGEVE